MILGIGTDLVHKDRIEAIYNKYDKRFTDKVLSNIEKKEFKKLKENAKVNFLCSSFSAKEALVKALGTGFRGIYPPDISIEKDKLGKPSIKSTRLETIKHHLSITNTDSYTLSFVVLEK
ncbi:MAG: holo-ACP synthase [Gammaproteobacteria bacterium]|jgi:holo-[acyl-carrier protein] synthase|tara:strand:- start:22103 stop:22459 length:357 start_codon:yes stop_codon:yes gene_type:complete